MLFTLLASSAADAQLRPRQYDLPTVIAGNAVIGGVTAALQATFAGKPVGKAFLAGALGGAVHGSGKVVSPDFPVGGLVLGAAGTSMVANASRGAGLLDELVMPVGIARIRWSRGSAQHVDVAINAFETATLARRLMQPGTRFDWTQSLQAGTFVLRTSERLASASGWPAAGITSGSVILLSDYASNPEQTLKHERIHAHQAWFFQEVWGRPFENALRTHVPGMRFIPRWLELGVTMPAALEIERHTIGPTGPIRSWRESEAESLEGAARP